MSVSRAGLILAAGILAGCVQDPASANRQAGLVRVCDGAECRDQPREAVTGRYADFREREQQQDPDAWRGEPIAALREAAQAGDARAAYRLGQAYEAGGGGLPRNSAAAARQYEVAAEAGISFAQWRLARLVEQGAAPGGRSRALQLDMAAAQGGVARAAHNLGVAFAEGRGTARDPVEAARWFTIAAENGVPESQYNLALMLFRGGGVPRRPFAALKWMRTAAQNGFLPAQRAAGRLYVTGLEEMGQDLTEARSLLAAAAGRGDAESRRLVAQIDRAVAAEQASRLAFERQMALQQEQTRALWGAVILNAIFSPPPIIVVW